MADVILEASVQNSGTVTPATAGSITVSAGAMLVHVIVAIGTSPTIALPGGGSIALQNVNGASLSMRVSYAPNLTAGAKNFSAALGGTLTGWIEAAFSFVQTGANEGPIASTLLTNNVAQLSDAFATLSPQQIYNMLMIYAVGRATATLTPQNAGVPWSNSVQPIAGVQGLSLDFFWASNQQSGYAPYQDVSASGLLSAAVNSVQIAAMFNSAARQPQVNSEFGQYVGQFFQGMIGG